MDKTILIPTPGGSRHYGNNYEGQGASMGAYHYGEKKISGMNPLVGAASVLLTLLNQIRITMQYSDVPNLHRKLVEEIRTFEQHVRAKGVNNENVLLARYLICTALDEAVLNTPWGSTSGWSQRSLLGIFHQESSGGEKAFVILSKLLENPMAYIEVLELYHLCISLGFQGRYRMASRGQEQLEHVRDGLIRTINQFRQTTNKSLSKANHTNLNAGGYFKNYIPIWVFASVVLAGILISFMGFRYWAYADSAKIVRHIQQDQKGINLIDLDTFYLNTDLNQ